MEDSILQTGFNPVDPNAFRVAKDLLKPPRTFRRNLVRFRRLTGQPDQTTFRIKSDLFPLESGNFNAGIVVYLIFKPLDSRRNLWQVETGSVTRHRRAQQRSKGTQRGSKPGFPVRITWIGISNQFHVWNLG